MDALFGLVELKGIRYLFRPLVTPSQTLNRAANRTIMFNTLEGKRLICVVVECVIWRAES